jgi:hypothetical protein
MKIHSKMWYYFIFTRHCFITPLGVQSDKLIPLTMWSDQLPTSCCHGCSQPASSNKVKPHILQFTSESAAHVYWETWTTTSSAALSNTASNSTIRWRRDTILVCVHSMQYYENKKLSQTFERLFSCSPGDKWPPAPIVNLLYPSRTNVPGNTLLQVYPISVSPLLLKFSQSGMTHK